MGFLSGKLLAEKVAHFFFHADAFFRHLHT